MSRVWLARDCVRSEGCFQEPLCSLQSTRIKSCISHIWAAQVSNTYVSLFTVLVVYHCHLFSNLLTTFSNFLVAYAAMCGRLFTSST
jgi:hypothetical protein